MSTQRRQEIELCNGRSGFRAMLGAEIRVLSESSGEVEYVASDETIDSCKEIVRADGWKFDLFSKNAPFVDTHDYSSIGKLLGNVIDWRIDKRKRQLIETVRWAKGVTGNTAAQLGWQMLVAGFGPKAVSVGFYPERVASKWDSDRTNWLAQLQALGIQEESGVRAIYISQQQIELSACILGANPNALQAAQKALAAGVINKREFNFLRSGTTSPQFQVPFPETQPDTDMKKNLLDTLDRITARVAPRSGLHEEPMESSGAILRLTDVGGLSLRTLCESVLEFKPEMRAWLGAVTKHFIRAEAHRFTDAEMRIAKALNTGSTPGSTLVPYDLAVTIYNLMSLYGGWRTLGVVPLAKGKTRVAQITGEGDARWIGRSHEGDVITPATLTGGGKDADCQTLIGLVEVSKILADDSKTTIEGALLEALVNSLNKGADFACFMANGDDDTTDGAQIGIFESAGVAAVNAAAGNVSIATLDFSDFANTVAGVSASALQRPCRWWINPVFLSKLMVLKDGNEKILKSPTTLDSEWMLAGFPVTWIAVGPNEDAAAKPIAAFGRGDAYMFALQKDFTLEASDRGPGWNKLLVLFRAIMRAQAQMRNAASFAILKTAAA